MKKLSILVLGLSLMLTLNSCSSTAENTTETTIENKEISNKNIEALFKDLEEKYGVTLGIYAINTTNNKEVSFNADERF